MNQMVMEKITSLWAATSLANALMEQLETLALGRDISTFSVQINQMYTQQLEQIPYQTIATTHKAIHQLDPLLLIILMSFLNFTSMLNHLIWQKLKTF